jgi:hypothetical protein
MERIGKPQVLLLEDYRRDGERVNRVLDYLESLQAVSVVRVDSMALDFFSDRELPPFAIILYMNSKTAIGVFRSANYRLLTMKFHGIGHLKRSLGKTVVNSGGRPCDVVDFLSALHRCKPSEAIFDN